MASARAPEIKKGMTLILDGELFEVSKRDHVTPGKGQAVHHVECRNLKTGNQRKLRLASGDTVELAYLDKKSCTYLYQDNTGYVFMDEEDYEQYILPANVIEESMHYIKDNSPIVVTFFDGAAVSVELPTAVTLEVIEAEEAAKGNTATNVTKGVKVETGLEVRTPAHIKVGDKIKISTEDSSFLGRVND
jgi:elongation factor P